MDKNQQIHFFSWCFAPCYLWSEKRDWCDNSEIEEVLGSDFYCRLRDQKDFLQLNLHHQKFEKQCFKINEILSKHGYFLRVYEQKKKFHTLFMKNIDKRSMIKKLCSCVVEKFNGFHIVSLKYGKKLRKKFKPVDIVYKPVKK